MSHNLSPAEAEPQVLTAMITPFEMVSGVPRVNFENAQTIASYLLDNGSDGLVLAGTTGESPLMTHEDQINLFHAVREAVGPETYLMGGTGSNATHSAVELTRQATDSGAVDGLLVVSPYYNRPSQHGIEDYYRQVSESTDLGLTLYNIPGRTGRLVTEDTINTLIDKEYINSIKDATGSTDMAVSLAGRFGDSLRIYSGDDSLNLEFASRLRRAGRAASFAGVISVASHYAGSTIKEMFAEFARGDDVAANVINEKLKVAWDFETSHTDESTGRLYDTPNPIPTKVMMGFILGKEIVGPLISPMVASDEEKAYLRNRAKEIYSQF